MNTRADHAEVARQLLAATRQLGAEQGIENIALRTVSAAVGRSTTAVFQHFGSKEVLVTASMEDAFARDTAFHEQMLASLRDMPAEPAMLGATVAFYVVRRSGEEAAQLWLEALYKSRQFPALRPLLTRWDAMRHAFWRDLLGSERQRLAGLIATYTAAEEAYAAALTQEPAYQLVLQETTARLFARHPAEASRGAAGAWLETMLPPIVPADREKLGEAEKRLLAQATRVIAHRGAADLNLRRVAADADTSPSQIVYHFGDFAALRRQAIVDVLLSSIPDMLNPQQPITPPTPPAEWTDPLCEAVRPAGPGQSAGFYVNYARVLGQACLLAKRDPVLRSLTLQLRAIEGAGIIRLSQAAWPDALRLERDGATAFAIWIKGHAIVNEATDSAEAQADGDAISQAAQELSGSR